MRLQFDVTSIIIIIITTDPMDWMDGPFPSYQDRTLKDIIHNLYVHAGFSVLFAI